MKELQNPLPIFFTVPEAIERMGPAFDSALEQSGGEIFETRDHETQTFRADAQLSSFYEDGVVPEFSIGILIFVDRPKVFMDAIPMKTDGLSNYFRLLDPQIAIQLAPEKVRYAKFGVKLISATVSPRSASG